jgi:hypothetical protein
MLPEREASLSGCGSGLEIAEGVYAGMITNGLSNGALHHAIARLVGLEDGDAPDRGRHCRWRR